MPSARRALTVAAGSAEVWRLLDDPRQLPRWWPGVRRVEALSPEGFTQVLYSSRGRPVRIDLRVAVREAQRRLVWEQEVSGSPFERHLVESVTEISLAPDAGGGTRVTIELRQRLRGTSRAGGWMLRRATGRRLEQALAGLAEVLGQRLEEAQSANAPLRMTGP